MLDHAHDVAEKAPRFSICTPSSFRYLIQYDHQAGCFALKPVNTGDEMKLATNPQAAARSAVDEEEPPSTPQVSQRR